MKVRRTLRNIGLATIVGVSSMLAPKYAQAVEVPNIEWRTAALMTQSEYDQREFTGDLPDTYGNGAYTFTDIDTAFNTFNNDIGNVSEPGVDLTVYEGIFNSGVERHRIEYNLKMQGVNRDNSEIRATLRVSRFADVKDLTLKGSFISPGAALQYVRGPPGSSGNLTNCTVTANVGAVLQFPVDIIGNTFISLDDTEGGVPYPYNGITIDADDGSGSKVDASESLVIIKDNQFLNEGKERYLGAYDENTGRQKAAINAGFVVNAGELIEGGNNVFIDCPTVVYSRVDGTDVQGFAGNAWGLKNNKDGNTVFYTDPDQIKELFVLPVEKRPYVDVSNPLGYNTLADDDRDGLNNGDEINIWGTDLADSDSDNDGLSDGYEALTSHTDPLFDDSDCCPCGKEYSREEFCSSIPCGCDGVDDHTEVLAGTNPLNPYDFPPEGTKLPAGSTAGLVALMSGVGLAGAAALRRGRKRN